MQRSLPVRVLQALVIGYVTLALVTRVMDAAGRRTCACYEDCWCNRPGLTLFRWVFPRWHKYPTLAEWKAGQDRD
jgi:hypothetical protein